MKKDDTDKPTTQNLHPTILDIFQNTCRMIVNENLGTHEFNHCVTTIQNTLAYLKAARKPQNNEE